MFNAGDHIRCVDASDAYDCLTEGTVYTVQLCDYEPAEVFIVDDGGDDGWWMADRFVLVVPESDHVVNLLNVFGGTA